MQVLDKEDIYKRELAEMQSQVNYLQIRVKELNSERDMLRQQLNECMQSRQHVIDAIEGK